MQRNPCLNRQTNALKAISTRAAQILSGMKISKTINTKMYMIDFDIPYQKCLLFNIDQRVVSGFFIDLYD